MIGPGVRAEDVDRAARGTIERLGFGEFFHQRTGYSIGLGYPPTWTERGMFSLNRGDVDLLEPGMVFHVIPALLLPGIGGFGFSETVLVTELGCDVLTSNPRSLRVA